jgi:uncharacterized protein (DUF58 family)
LPFLVGILLVMQLTYPYKGWVIMLVGFGGVWLVGFLWARALARGLTLYREMRFGWAHVGDRLEERFTLLNTSALPALWVEVEDHTTMPDYNVSRVTGVSGQSENRWKTQGVCTRRGLFMLGPTTLHTGDPFGLYRVTLYQPNAAALTVTPPIVPLPIIEVAPGGQVGEGRSRPNAFERTVSSSGVREYVAGDSLSRIHWPTSARKRNLHIRLFDSTPAGNWWIFLDLDERTQVGQGDDSTTEHSVILTASLTDQGLRQGRAVGLVTHGEELVWLPPQGGDNQRHKILQQLALIHPGPRSLAELLARSQTILHQITSLVIITAAADDHAWVEALLPLLQRGIVATVLLLDPVTFGGAGEIGGTMALLNKSGVKYYVITPDLLNQAGTQVSQQGLWDWHISPQGRAIAVSRPEDMEWKAL